MFFVFLVAILINPMSDLFGHTRARIAARHALITPANHVASEAVLWLVMLSTCAAKPKVKSSNPAPMAAGTHGLRRGPPAVTWRVLTIELPS